MTATTLNQVHDIINERHERCQDVKASSREMEWTGERSIHFLEPMTSLVQGYTHYEGELNDHAFKQVSERFKVPPSWAMDNDDCPRALRTQVFNWKFKNVVEKKMLMRTIATDPTGTVIRGVLSDKYQPYDHVDLWDAVTAAASTMPTEPKVILRGPVDDALRGYLLFDNIRFDAVGRNYEGPRPQDGGGSGGLHPAVYFANDEVGRGRVRVSAGLYRAYCDNGLIYGWKEQGAIAITHLFSAKKHIALAVHEGIANALALSEEAAHQMLVAMDKRIQPTKLDGIFDRWAKDYGITVESKEAWKAMVRAEPSVFDVVNAATVIAHDRKNYEEVENIERMAGDMLASLTEYGS